MISCLKTCSTRFLYHVRFLFYIALCAGITGGFTAAWWHNRVHEWIWGGVIFGALCAMELCTFIIVLRADELFEEYEQLESLKRLAKPDAYQPQGKH